MIFSSFFTILLLLTQSTFSMNSTIYQDTLAYQIENHIGLFSHDSICALALVNKYLNKTIEQTSPQRKKSLEKHGSIIDDQTTWHKYNSAYTYWTHFDKIVKKRKEKQVTLHLVHLHGDSMICHRELQCLPTENYKSNPLLFKEYRPFFNSKGHACFHARGQFDMQKGAEQSRIFSPSYRTYVFEYSISTNGLKKQLPCYVNLKTNKIHNDMDNLFFVYNYEPELLQKILASKFVTEKPISAYDRSTIEIYDKGLTLYQGNIKVYDYDDTQTSSEPIITNNVTKKDPEKPTLPNKIIKIPEENKIKISQLSNDPNIPKHLTQISSKPTISDNITQKDPEKPALPNKIVEIPEENKIRISQLSNDPNTPKRLRMEIDNAKNLVTNAYHVNCEEHPFEIEITFYTNEIKYAALCKMPSKYPFRAPIISLKTTDNQLDAQDLIAIEKILNNKFSRYWSPQNKLYDIANTISTEIQSYKDKKTMSQLDTQGYQRTIAYLKEKYPSENTIFEGKYPEFQKKLHGLWVKETTNGYFVLKVII